jgi:hypothetical protein
MSEEIARAIPGARLERLSAAHLTSLEQAERFNQVLCGFLREIG